MASSTVVRSEDSLEHGDTVREILSLGMRGWLLVYQQNCRVYILKSFGYKIIDLMETIHFRRDLFQIQFKFCILP